MKNMRNFFVRLLKPSVTVILASASIMLSGSACACCKFISEPEPTAIPIFTPEPAACPAAPSPVPAAAPEFSSEPAPPPFTNPERILAGMTLEEKIGQLFFVLPEALCKSYFGKADSFTPEMKAFLNKYPAGGIILSLNNISSPGQLKILTDDMQCTSKFPLFIGMDEEGGKITRIACSEGFNVKTFPPMLEIGKTGNPEKAYEVGFTIGGYLREYGVNVDFAPVADVVTNQENTVIGSRSFGSDPNLAASMAEAEILGFHAQGIIACAKHFPGHGNTKGDTHFNFVKIDKNWTELLNCELIPFQAAIDSSCDMIMAAHIAAPAVTGNELPATLSYMLITEKLRNEMGFSGVVITDAMAMKAITDLYSSGEAALKAIKAGVDIILAPKDYEEAFTALYEAVKSGEISEARIDESVLRILELKEKYITVNGFDWDNYGK